MALTLERQLEAMETARKLREECRMAFFNPTAKQQEFFDLGLTAWERQLRAGNQLGKSDAGAYEFSCHLTGEYPADWLGYRFRRPVRAWACGETGLDVRNVIQTKLCGDYAIVGSLGTGFIPKDCFTDKPSMARGVTDAFDTITVRHKIGGISRVQFKSYEQGREKFQGEPVDLIWADEEPPMDIYTEMLARLTATHGIIFVTYTPLNGVTKLIKRFRQKVDENGNLVKGRAETLMTLKDATHLSAEIVERILKQYPLHEREARLNGVPLLGSGGVFEEVNPQMLRVPLSVRGEGIWHSDLGQLRVSHWSFMWAIDFGIAHPFAAVLLAWDRDFDCIYVLHEIKMEGAVPKAHAERMRAIAADVPVAWPHDGTAHEKGSGEQLVGFYKKEKLKMLSSHATFADGGYSTEAGIMDMIGRMRSDRFKVAEGCTGWFDEFSGYHRKNGLIVKEHDDLLSATRIGCMQIRSSRAISLGFRPQAGARRGKGRWTPDQHYLGIDP